MEKITTYTKNGYTIDLHDLFIINNIKILIKELFTFNNKIYISYESDDKQELKIELAETFIENNNNFFNTKINLTPTETNNTCCSCENK